MRWGLRVYQDFSKDHGSVFSLVGTWGEGEVLKAHAQVKTVEG